MKTEQEIQEAAENYAYGFTDNTFARQSGFKNGVKWMQEQDNWISVEDMLPDFGIKVLVFGEQKGLNPQIGGACQHVSKRQDLSHMESKFHGLRDRNDKNGFVNMSYVTHWQPLPNPPKAK